MKKLMILALSFGMVCVFFAGAHTRLKGDFDNDGDVDGNDLADFSENYGKSGNSCSNYNNCDTGDYCAKATGDCDGEGTCTPRPSGCPDVWDPVCGCDGATYGNFCEAAAAGINVDHGGECAAADACHENVRCDSTHYCAKATGDCNGEGICTRRPDFCLDIYDPVCGCDGRTYGNACFAAAKGINVNHDGNCQ